MQNRLNTMMQNTASWLDNVGLNEERDIDDNASANGYLQLAWLPRTRNLGVVDANFKIALNLPRWNDRFAVVIDNDHEDELLLDYESNYEDIAQSDLNLAAQYIKQFNKQSQVKTRFGISRNQLYLRNEMKLSWQIGKTKLKLQPRIDYFWEDGWGPGAKGVINYQFEQSYFSLSASWQKLESEARSRRKLGFYHISPTGENQILVTGIQYVKSNNKEDVSNESYFISMRYRNLLYKSWMYIELEPFLEFSQQNNFKREAGIALSLISYYGN